MNYLLAPNYTESEIDRNLLKHARNDLEALISKRDWYVNDTHHPFLPLALYRTLTRSSKIRRMNKAIEYMQAKVDALELDEATSVYHKPVHIISEQVITLLNMLTASGLAWCGSIDDIQVTGQLSLSSSGADLRAIDKNGITVFENKSDNEAQVDFKALVEQAHGLNVKLDALARGGCVFSLHSDDKTTYTMQNEWVTASYPANTRL